MYNKLSFEDQLSQKYLNQQLIQIQRRKPLYTEEKERVKRKRTTHSVRDDIQVQIQNKRLVQKLMEVKFNPAYVKKMYMGADTNPLIKNRSSHQNVSQVKERNFSSLKQRQIRQQNKRLKRTIELIKQQKKTLVLPSI